MSTVTVITGLSGSGKTHLGKEMKMAGVKLFNERVRPDLPQNWPRFFKELAAGYDCAVVEIAYLRQWARDELLRKVRQRYPDTVFEWIFFENDLEAANWNCINDPDRTPEQIEADLKHNAHWTMLYEIPDGTTPQKIFRLPQLLR